MLALAAREPATLVLGIDPNAAAMAEASRRAAGPARKGGLGNARFVLAAAEAVPAELAGRAGLVTVSFPWGSLLRGCVGLDETVAGGLAALVGGDGGLDLLLAPAARDGLDGIPTTRSGLVESAARAFHPHGLRVIEGRAATDAEIAATPSTWARRLLAGGRGDRGATIVRLGRIRG